MLIKFIFAIVILSGCAHIFPQKQMVETNKSSVPSWIGIPLGMLHWEEDHIIFVTSRKNLRELELGVLQTEHYAYVSFSRAIFLKLLREIKNNLVPLRHFSGNSDFWNTLYKILDREIRAIVFKEVLIDDIYYRKWNDSNPKIKEHTEVLVLSRMKVANWLKIRQNIKVRLLRSHDKILKVIGRQL